jgi:signal transduction histidine kinase
VEADPRLVSRFARAARVLAIAVTAVGALVFAGWVLDTPALDRFLAGQFIRQLSSGLALLFAGGALFALASGRERGAWVAPLLSLATAAIGGFILVENATGWAPFARLGQNAAQRMEPDTALDFVAVGLALSCVAVGRERWVRAGQVLAGLAGLVAIAALFGHAYSVKAFFGVTAYLKMSLAASCAFLALALGTWLARPDAGYMALVSSNGAAGAAARRLYPAVIAIPVVLGALTLAGEEQRLYNGKFGLSLLVIASIVVLVVLVAFTGGAVDKSEQARLRLAAVLLEEAERRNLARELHDEIGQLLAALKLRLELLPDAGTARKLVEELMARVSSLSLDLRPAMLDDLGLLPALLWLFGRYRAQTGVAVEFAHEGLEPRPPRESETAAFRIVQEALSNAAKHAGVSSVAVRVFRRDGRLVVTVEDGGKGFDPAAALAGPTTSGLLGMRERASALGGTLTIDAAAGRGTRLHAELPVS